MVEAHLVFVVQGRHTSKKILVEYRKNETGVFTFKMEISFDPVEVTRWN